MSRSRLLKVVVNDDDNFDTKNHECVSVINLVKSASNNFLTKLYKTKFVNLFMKFQIYIKVLERKKIMQIKIEVH